MRKIYPLLLLIPFLSCKNDLDILNPDTQLPPQSVSSNFKTDNFVGQFKALSDSLNNQIFPQASFLILNIGKGEQNDLSIKIQSSCPQTPEMVLKATAKSDSTFEINPQTVNSINIAGEGKISKQNLKIKIKNSEKVLLDYTAFKTASLVNPQLLKIESLSSGFGVENDSLTILGTGFSEIPKHNIVTFDGQKAEVISSTTSSLTVRIPKRKTKTAKVIVSVDSCQTTETSFEYLTDTWKLIPSELPRDGRWYATSFSIGNKGYICMGIDQDRNRLKDLWEFDSETQKWTKRADYTAASRNAAVAFVIDGMAYLGTGHNGVEGSNDFWKYNPQTDEWSKIADLPSGKREHAIAFALNGKGYVGTGKGKNGWYKDLWEYDPRTNRWSQKSNIPGPDRAFAVAYTYNGKAYLGGGHDGETDKGWLGDWYEYDPTTDKFTPKANFKVRDAYGFQTNNRGYLLYEDAQKLAVYDFVHDKWMNLNVPFDKLTLHGVTFSMESRAFFGTGFNGQYKTKFWEYIP